jgi:hypothetical protein
MGGTGVEMRMKLLRDAADQQLVKPLRTHGWIASITQENTAGEYLIVEATKSGVTRRLALLYTSATDNNYYKVLDATVDFIFTNGALYLIEQFAYGISKPVAPVSEFFPVLLAWNKELAPSGAKSLPSAQPQKVRTITAEDPRTGIWARLDQFGSVTLAHKLVARRAEESGKAFTIEEIKTKAEGLAFAIRNASDYFRETPSESLNKRILSLYYGALALASAEMMASPEGPVDLDEIEGITRQGHGLYTVSPSTEDFGELTIGVLATGFFPRWMSFLGEDVSRYPRAKAKTASDLEKQVPDTFVTIRDLLSAIPEVGDLFLEVYASAPSWVTPVYSVEDNRSGSGANRSSQTGSTYIRLIDRSKRVKQEAITAAGWPIAELSPIGSDSAEANSFRVRVDHADRKAWHEALRLHRSPFKDSPSLIIPVLGISEHRVLTVIVLYALSILVRYMPSAWRRVEGGDWDEHLALITNVVGTFERLLPEQFLGSILQERIHAVQPGAFF